MRHGCLRNASRMIASGLGETSPEAHKGLIADLRARFCSGMVEIWRTRCDIDGHCNCWEILLPMDRLLFFSEN